MKKSMKRVRRQSFTLVEVIAVLLVIAILAAVAAPRFVSIAAEARNGIAKAGINEAKATLSVAYAKAYLAAEGGAVNGTAVMSQAGFVSGTTYDFGDINVKVTVAGNTVTLNAIDVKGSSSGVTAWDTWAVPQQ